MENIKKEKFIDLHRTYLSLDKKFYTLLSPQPVNRPSIYCYNNELASRFNIKLDKKEITDYFSGNRTIPRTKPFAQAYAGHQFGQFSVLGDGRAIVLGEIRCGDKLYDIQLKGSGRTPYSRNGDGRATLPTMLREYLISEAMHNLKIATTRSLCVMQTEDKVYRENVEKGAVLTRIAESHIRIGTFEYASLIGREALQQLLTYTIDRHYPDLKNKGNQAQSLLKKVIDNQIKLIIEWIRVGFIHGVMNTDNTSISGETIDYGPCAFMNSYDEKTVYSSIDTHGRYSFGNQAVILKWNIARLAESLLTLIHDREKEAIKISEDILDHFDEKYQSLYYKMMGEKLGFLAEQEGDRQLIKELLRLLTKYKRDYTNTFLKLSNIYNPFTDDKEIDWYNTWKKRIGEQDLEKAKGIMRQNNPTVIPRNHYVEKAIRDKEEFSKFLNAIKAPYDYTKAKKDFQDPPKSEVGYKTYCGT